MKVTLNEFKTAFALFQSEFISGMKTGLNKFIVGAVLAANERTIDAFLSRFSDEDGMVDVDAVKSIVDAGMKGCGGEFELPINFGVLSSIGATPVNVKFGLDDVEKFFGKTLPAVSNGKK